VRGPQLGRDQRSLLRRPTQQTHISAATLRDVVEPPVGSCCECANAPGHPKTHLTQYLGLPV